MINFLIVAFCVFLVVQGVNRLKRKEALKPQEPAALPADVVVLTEIRDLLKENIPAPRRFDGSQRLATMRSVWGRNGAA